MFPLLNKWFPIFSLNILSGLWIFFLTGCGFSHNANKNLWQNAPGFSEFSSREQNLFSRVNQKPVDIVFVVDTSYSMYPYLEKVDQLFSGFLNEFSSFSWRIMFINSDYDPSGIAYYRRDLFSGRLISLELKGSIITKKVLDSHINKNEEIFIDTLKRYTSADGFFSADQDINPCELPPYCQGRMSNPLRSLAVSVELNKDRFRESADFIAVIFSNGDESIPLKTNIAQTLNSLFQTSAGGQKKVKIFSIAIVPGDTDCLQKNFQKNHNKNNFDKPAYASSIFSAVASTSGKIMSICSSRFLPLARAISNAL